MDLQNNINVQFINTKDSCKEAITPNEDGSYTLFLNARMNHETHLKSYLHAMKHVAGSDFDKKNVQEIEKEAHKD